MTNAQDVIISSEAKIRGAPRVDFILSDEYLITYAIASKTPKSVKFSNDLYKLKKIAKKIDPMTYRQFQQHRSLSVEVITSPVFIKSNFNFFDKVKRTQEYKIIKDQTLTYMKDGISNWESNLIKSTEFMNRYSGFNFDINVRAYITHPSLANGRVQNTQEKILSFGAWPTFDNYFTIYIWHEILHFYMNKDKISHAVNQLLTDNDLRLHLGGGKLLPFQGHPDLFEIMKTNLNKWEIYKKSPTNLNKFVVQLKTN